MMINKDDWLSAEWLESLKTEVFVEEEEGEAWCGRCHYSTAHDDPWTPQMRRALELIRELFWTRDGICGGPLHVQLEDLNLYDDQSFNHEPIDYSLPSGYQWKDESNLRRICDELWPLLQEMGESERFSVVCAFHKEHYKKWSSATQ